MIAVLRHADDVLRARRWPAETGDRPRSLLWLTLLIIVSGMLYGAVMGSFAGPEGPRPVQMLYSALKVPLLLLVSFTLGLPSFFVVNTLLGLRADFAAALRALIATQAGLTIVLASFAPFTALWYLSTRSYDGALLFNAAMFGLASMAAQMLLQRLYRPLILRDPRHATLLRIWLGIYAFIGIQMAWVLRPFVGVPGSRTTFFREGAWGNAYEEVIRIAWRFVS